jgi:hypothetical protein
MALEPSIDFDELTAIYVTATFPSPLPPISGWGWLVGPLQGTPLQVKIPWAVDGSGNLVQPLKLDDAIPKAGGVDRLAAGLQHLPSAGVEVAKSTAGGFALPLVLAIYTAGAGIFLEPVSVPIGFIAGVVGRHRMQVDDGSFLDQNTANPCLTAECTAWTKDGYFSIERIEGMSLAKISGYLFFPRGKYSAVGMRVTEYDPLGKSFGRSETVSAAWPPPASTDQSASPISAATHIDQTEAAQHMGIARRD